MKLQPQYHCRHHRALLLAVLLLTGFAASGQDAHLRLLLHAPGLPDSAQAYVSGSLPQLGNWQPGATPMTRIDASNWRLDLQLPEGTAFAYKHTLGSWDHEALDAAGHVPENHFGTLHGDTTLFDTAWTWKSGTIAPQPLGGIRGRVEHHSVPYAEFGKREIVVWLPPGYETHKRRRYPVLYMHDGQNVFDPKTSSFGRDWQVDETCDSLIRYRRLPPLIVVGIYNSPQRSAEYNPLEAGNAYKHMLLGSIKPFVDDNYPTRPGRRHTYTGGSSMGGLIAFDLAWRYPQVFAGAICMSPAFQYKGFDYVATLGPGKPKTRFYIDNGGLDLEQVLQPGCEAMLAELRKRGYRDGRDILWVHAPEAAHNEPAWARRMPTALRWLCR